MAILIVTGGNDNEKEYENCCVCFGIMFNDERM